MIVPENRPPLETLRAWLRELDTAPDTAVVVSHDLGAANLPEEARALPAWL